MWMGSTFASLPARPLPRWRLLLRRGCQESCQVLMSWAYDTVRYYYRVLYHNLAVTKAGDLSAQQSALVYD